VRRPRAENSAINAPAWLTARPIAHRGLHSKARGVVENTRAAARAAIAGSYAIECDIQLACDGEAVVFHDFTLDRLTEAKGGLDFFSARDLAAIAYKDCGETVASLPDFLREIGGATPLVIEIKSRFDGDHRLAARLLAILSGYEGPASVKSFDPSVLAFLRGQEFDRPIGLVAQARYDGAEWPELTAEQRFALAALTDFSSVRPDFLSWHVGDLPHATPELCRAGIGMPVMTWTVRSASDRTRAAEWADQMIFEGFEP
jgi:glycerophosphoryl diester phosphodiesterase